MKFCRLILKKNKQRTNKTLIFINPFADQCRQLQFGPIGVYRGKRLINHVIRTAEVTDDGLCRALCYVEPNCVSYNFLKRVDTETHICELNNSTYQGNEGDMKANSNYLYREAKVRKSCKPSSGMFNKFSMTFSDFFDYPRPQCKCPELGNLNRQTSKRQINALPFRGLSRSLSLHAAVHQNRSNRFFAFFPLDQDITVVPADFPFIIGFLQKQPLPEQCNLSDRLYRPGIPLPVHGRIRGRQL